jgi:hypothetical protein
MRNSQQINLEITKFVSLKYVDTVLENNNINMGGLKSLGKSNCPILIDIMLNYNRIQSRLSNLKRITKALFANKNMAVAI